MFGDVRVVDRVAASVASWPRLGFDGTVMNCHDDSQRSNRLAVTVGHLHPRLAAVIVADSLFIEQVRAARCSFLLVAKPEDHTSLSGARSAPRFGYSCSRRGTRCWCG